LLDRYRSASLTEATQIKERITARLPELRRNTDAFGFEFIEQYMRGEYKWPGDIAARREAGGSHISVVTMGANLTTVGGHLAAIRRRRDAHNSARQHSTAHPNDRVMNSRIAKA